MRTVVLLMRALTLSMFAVLTPLESARAEGLWLSMDVEQLSQLGIPALAHLGSVGPLRGSARLSVVNGVLRLDGLRARVATPRATLTLKGSVGDASRWTKLDLEFRLQSESARWLTGDEEGPVPAPLSVSGRLRSDARMLRITQLALETPGSQVSGSISVDPGDGVPRVIADLHAAALDLDEFRAPGGLAAAEDGRVFSNEPLPLSGIAGMRATLRLVADRLTFNGLQLAGTTTSLETNTDGTRINSTGSLAGGSYDVALHLVPTGTSTEAALDMALSQVSWEQASRQLGFDDYLDGGPTDASVTVRGRGRSLRQIAATANGQVRLRIGRGRVYNTILHDAGVDLLERFVGLFTPAEDGASTTTLECTAVRLRIRDGIAHADDGLVVLTDKVSMAGTGRIDLRNETLSMAVALNAREGWTFSPASLAGGARITGTLSSPVVEASSTGLATTAVTVAGAVATGGLSLLAQKLLSGSGRRTLPCTAALEGEPGASAAGKRPAAGNPVTRATDAITDAVGEGLRKLFGR